MKSKQVLSIEQMQHLQELGLELKPSLVHYYNVISEDNGKWYLSLTIGDILDGSPRHRYIPAYTLQDILDLLPYKTVASYLHIGRKSFSGDILFYVEYSNFGGYAVSHFRSESLIEAAYEMLCWCVDNGHVETDKNK